VIKYNVKRQLFFNWYFNNQPREQISAFVAPHLLGLVTKDVNFSLDDIFGTVNSIPTTLIENYTGKLKTINTTNVELIK
jgi:hypothetical protein